jgi:hypothetical protein
MSGTLDEDVFLLVENDSGIVYENENGRIMASGTSQGLA